MSAFSFIKDLFKPAAKLIDDIHTSTEEKMKLTNALKELEFKTTGKMIDLEVQALEARSKNVEAEINGHSWLQRNWRPITMLTFLVLVILDSLGLLANPLPKEAWLLLQLGLGGYVAGRSVEKVADKLIGKS